MSVNPSTGRMRTDVLQLISKKHEVKILSEEMTELCVKFYGPKDTPYEGGVWKVRVTLPENYPFKSPSIGFVNTIFHPNIEEVSGSVCLNVLNQAWTPLYDLAIIFETFLPQLLTYPNAQDPLNICAASLYLTYPDIYKKKVLKYVQTYAKEYPSEDAAKYKSTEQNAESDDSVSDLSEDEM